MVPVRVQRQVQSPLRPDGFVDRAIPAEQGFVIPQAQFTLPAIAAFRDRGSALSKELQDFAALTDLQRVGVDPGMPVFPGLPPPTSRPTGPGRS
jgi:hypothetical protein